MCGKQDECVCELWCWPEAGWQGGIRSKQPGRIFKAPSLPRGVPPISLESQRKHGTGTLSLRVLHQPLPGICYNFEYITLES